MKKVKVIPAVGLVIALAVLLCACGDSKESVNEKSPSADLDIGTAGQMESANISNNVNAALAKENVYRVNEIELPELPDGCKASVECTAYWDDRIYAAMRITEHGNESKSYCVLSMDESGNILHTVFLEIPEYDDAHYSDFVIGNSGRTYALSQSEDGQHQYMCCWQTDGRLLWQSEVCADSSGLNVWSIFTEADGSLKLILTGENAYRLNVGEDGSLSESDKEKLSDETFKVLRNCRRLIRKTDGSCLLLCTEREGGLDLVKYDMETDELGEAYRLPDELLAVSLSSTIFSAGVESDLIYAGRDGVFVWDMGDEQVSPKMNYINSDRNLTDIYSLLEFDGTHFLMFYKEDYTEELKAGIFEYVRPEDIPDKAVVVLAGLNVNNGIKKRVIQYNRESSQYRVVVKEYESVEKLNLDIASGYMSDILMTESLPNGESIPMESYIKKGLIADVGALIEKDEELSRQEFMTNVFDAYSIDGKLRYVVPSFTLSTMAAKASLVGDEDGWCMERMTEALEGMSPNTQLLAGLDRNTFLEMVMRYRGNDFIDGETGKCTFDSREFTHIMEFAYNLPETGNFAGESEEAYISQYLEDRTLLFELHVWSFSQNVDERLFFILNGYLEGDYVFVGFPGIAAESAGNRKGAVIIGENVMALSAESENGDGAWDFARYYLTDEYQRSLESSLPVRKDIFEEWAEEETLRPYYMDESGKKTEYDLTIYRNGEETVVPPLNQEQLDELIAYVESVTTTTFEDKNVMNIINEEMGAYFAGQKNAEETAKLIQNRVQLYLNERM